jgi:ketosteroid isomerase-like protein
VNIFLRVSTGREDGQNIAITTKNEGRMTAITLTPELASFVHEQADRQAILDCLHRYTRGIDRHDRELMLSAYHPDAWDDHGAASGTAAEFVNWAIKWHGEFQTRHQHIITNHTVEIDGDTAHGETYYMFWGINREGPPTLAFGRYVDRFEKRNGRWAIAYRICINEHNTHGVTAILPQEWQEALDSTGPNARSRQDVSYRRPLIHA